MDVLLAVLPIILTALGLAFAIYQWKQASLRREEVHRWADECIFELRRLATLFAHAGKIYSDAEIESVIRSSLVSTSALVDRGRIFFKNEVSDDWGADKPTGFRGYRPKILDQMMIAHRLAIDWHTADAERRIVLASIADEAARTFVSLILIEVARTKAASVYAGKGGSGANIDRLIADAVVARPPSPD